MSAHLEEESADPSRPSLVPGSADRENGHFRSPGCSSSFPSTISHGPSTGAILRGRLKPALHSKSHHLMNLEEIYGFRFSSSHASILSR